MLICKILTIEEEHIMFILPDRHSVYAGLDPLKLPHASRIILSSWPSISAHCESVGVSVWCGGRGGGAIVYVIMKLLILHDVFCSSYRTVRLQCLQNYTQCNPWTLSYNLHQIRQGLHKNCKEGRDGATRSVLQSKCRQCNPSCRHIAAYILLNSEFEELPEDKYIKF